jgi:hypothetical protein
MTAYHFFAGEGSTPYIHVVVEVDPGRYRHFGFGNIEKVGDWAGGEYCYGHYWAQGASAIDYPNSTDHQAGFDNGPDSNHGTMRLDGADFPNESSSTVWAVITSATFLGNDTAGNPRASVIGGARGGPWSHYLAWIPTSNTNAYKPLIPIGVMYVDQATSPYTYNWLGQQPDVAVVNMKNLSPGDEITIGSDTWMVFPWVKKQYTLGDVEESWNAGWAYKKVT